MLSLKEKRLCIEYVRNPDAPRHEIAQSATNKKLSKGGGANRVKKLLDNPEAMAYINELQSNIVKRLSLSQEKEIKKLEKVFKKSMKLRTDANGNRVPVNLASAISARAQIQKMTGLDQVEKEKIELDTSSIDFDDPNYAEKVLIEIMGKYMNRSLDGEDLGALMKSLDTLATYRLGSKVEDQLSQIGVKSGSLFDRPAVINKKDIT